jgi:hypothetical protein
MSHTIPTIKPCLQFLHVFGKAIAVFAIAVNCIPHVLSDFVEVVIINERIQTSAPQLRDIYGFTYRPPKVLLLLLFGNHDAVAATLESARVDHLLAGKALKDAAAAANYADMDVAVAKAAVRAEVDRLLRRDDVTDAHEIEMALNRVRQLGLALLHRTVANEQNGHAAPREVTVVLTRLDLPLIDRRDIAVNLTTFGDTAARGLNSAAPR